MKSKQTKKTVQFFLGISNNLHIMSFLSIELNFMDVKFFLAD